MTTHFLRLLDCDNKETALDEVLASLHQGKPHDRHFEVEPADFAQVPGSSFAYWERLTEAPLMVTG